MQVFYTSSVIFRSIKQNVKNEKFLAPVSEGYMNDLRVVFPIFQWNHHMLWISVMEIQMSIHNTSL